MNTVNTALYRRSNDEGDVIRIGRNWALAEWYPGRCKKPTAVSEAREDARVNADAESSNTD